MADITLEPTVPASVQLVKRAKDAVAPSNIVENDVILRHPLGLKRIDEVWVRVPFTYDADGVEVGDFTIPSGAEVRVVGA